ncbi:MAG: replicative DNA helicase [Polyangiaceae bacterium]
MSARVPPHDLAAEAAVLSACMLSRDALDDVRDILAKDHFYADANYRIYEAICALDDAGAPFDVVSVASKLTDAGRLQQVGGAAYLGEICDATPAVANVAHHAAIVRDKARLRAVIAECQRIAAEGYVEVEDVEAWCDAAEAAVFAASQRDAAGEGEVNVGPLVGGVITAAAQAMASGPPSGPTWPWRLLADRLGRLKPYVYVVAGRPGMGKSVFGQGVCVGVAQQGYSSVFASLEMEQEQIACRMVAAEGRVDGKRLERGELNAQHFRDACNAAEALRKLPIQIRYRPGATVSQIRAAARKAFRELGKTGAKPGVLVIDYLQLIDDQREKGETRDQAIGRIMRALVRLAAELGVAIVVLSQLNREVEKRPNKRPIMADLRECVTGDTLVMLADGRRLPVAELVGARPRVVSVTPAGKLVSRRATSVWKVGRRQVLDVVTTSGRRIRATADHRLLSGAGWVRVGALREGDRLALARRTPEPKGLDWSDSQIALLGHLVGDGSYVSRQPLRYTTASEEYARIVEAGAAEFGCTTRRSKARGRWFQVLIAGNGTRWAPRGVGAWLRHLGIWNQRSREKRIPQEAFRLSRRQVALLLRHLWATDGTIYTLKKSGRSWVQVAFTTASRGLADDVAALLLRVAIVARVVRLPKKSGASGDVFAVQITGGRDQKAFLREVGGDGHRAEQVRAALGALGARSRENTNVDTLPMETWQAVRESMKRNGVTQRAMAKARGTEYGGASHFKFAPSRSVVAEYATILGDSSLALAARSDFFWDSVASVTPAGSEDVYDLTVPGTASWLADGIVSHNSGNVEQDAHAILFLYRDDYYFKDSPDRGIAEIGVAKDRGGSTGYVKLKFTGEYTRFDNLASEPDGWDGDFDKE